MAVFKKQGVYWIDYYVSGRRKRERIGPDKRLAETVLRKRKVAIAEGKFLDKRSVPRCTFDELATLYLAWARVHHRSYRTTRSRVAQLAFVFGGKQLGQITPLLVDAYKVECARHKQPATVNREMAVLRHMFVQALAWEKASVNPVAQQRPLRVDNRRLRYLTLDETRRLLQAAPGPFRTFLTVAIRTGLRRGELFALTWDDIDLARGVLRVVQSKNGERRELPMSQKVREALRLHPRRVDSPYVFPRDDGTPAPDIRRAFASALTAAGISACRFHDLRHTFASHLVMAGVDLITVKEFLGHKDIKMTLRYAHLAPDYKRAAITHLDTYMDTSEDIHATAEM